MIPPRKTLPFLLALAGVLSVTPGAHSQALSSMFGNSQAPASSAPAAANDPLKRTTPRSSIYELLQACHDNNLPLAAQYLDLTKLRRDLRTTEGPDLALGLCSLLDRDTQFEVGRLSNDPAGSIGDNLTPNLDRLASFDVSDEHVLLTIERTVINGSQIWLVSPDSVAQIPRLLAIASESPIEKKLPAALVQTKLVGTPIYVWLALVLAALLLAVLSKLISRFLLAIVRAVSKRTGKNFHDHRLESFVEPLRLVVSVMIFSAVIQSVGPSAILRDYLFKFLTLLFFIGVASIVMRIVDVISDTVTSRLNPRERALSYSVVPLFVRAIKVLICGIAVLGILSGWGYNTNTILAGLGVGGLAVALAAQKTIENLFGGVSVITDRPVLVGDFCRFGDQVGTIEDIGLRSTRIRTLDRTVVTIPNSVFSTMTLENFAKRDRMWFHPTLQLSRDHSPDEIRAMMDSVVRILEDHPMVDPTTVPLRFTKINKESFDLDVFAYVLTPSFDEYLKVQTELLLKIVKAAQDLEIKFAVPLQQTLIAPSHVKTLTSMPTATDAVAKSG